MNIALWTLQAVLALAFLFFGAGKIAQPREKLIAQMPWVADTPQRLVQAIGAAEVAGGLGLVLPAATGIAPILTPVAAAGLGLLMVLAAGFHLRRREPQVVTINVVLLILTGIVAWARFGPYAL